MSSVVAKARRKSVMESDKAQRFLAAFSRSGSLHKAGREIGNHPSTHYVWLKDPAYAAAFELARVEAVDYLVREARRRAVDGVREPIYQQGQLVGWKSRYSDGLLEFLIKSWDRRTYGDQSTNKNLNVNADVTAPKAIDVSKLSMEEIRSLEQLLAKAAGITDAIPNDPS